ncbi:MAG: hypothetical protein U0520_02615 [Candidatus Saccharimonadales bacterium]
MVVQNDDEIRDLIQAEHDRQTSGLEMIPSENHTSANVMAALGSCLTDKYSEGYPGQRYYGGCEFVDKVENLARDRAKALFGATHANVQAHSVVRLTWLHTTHCWTRAIPLWALSDTRRPYDTRLEAELFQHIL